ncbi:MAG: GNAT family N-acetyltransferase [Patescibacteria group bacterium]|nr:GNAT family N-acetyltransferase [Patescibacteria group bacterium]
MNACHKTLGAKTAEEAFQQAPAIDPAMTIRFVEESLRDKFEKHKDLFTAHYLELATNQDIQKLDPDLERYYLMEDAGVMVSIFMYLGERVIGYSLNVLSAHLHYKGLGFAQNDVLYVDPAFRNGKAGLLLIAQTEMACREKGADIMHWHAKPNTPLDSLLPRIGYMVQDIAYTKVL